MEKNLIEKYYELQDGLKSLFKHLNTLHAENRRLAKENMELRHEVSMLRLYVDTHEEEGRGEKGIPELQKRSPVDREALEFYRALPDEFNFATLFELSEMLEVDLETVKKYLRLFLQEQMLRQRGSRIEKTGYRPPYLSESEDNSNDFFDDVSANF